MGERSFFVRLNIDDMADSLDELETTEERGLWLEGFRFGVRGKEARDGWQTAKSLGYKFGFECWEQAQQFREKQAAKGRASGESRRGRIEPESNHGSTAVQPEFNRGSSVVEPEPNQTPTGHEPIQNPEANNQELKNQEQYKPIPPTPQRGERVRASIPTEDEWVAYCTATWPDWHPTCAAEGWAYYQSAGWRTRVGPIRDWRAAAKTSYGNARQWGKLQPTTGGPRPWNGRPGPATARRSTDQALIDQIKQQEAANAASQHTGPTPPTDGSGPVPEWWREVVDHHERFNGHRDGQGGSETPEPGPGAG